MRGRVAIRKAAFLAPLLAGLTSGGAATAGAATVGTTAAMAGGRMAAGAAGKKAAKEAATSSFTDKIKDAAAERVAGAPQEAGEKMAEKNRQSQASMEQRGQQMAEKAKHGSQITTGEPMNLAWRMLKGELQLPHQISSALHDDIMTLDRQHKMTDTNEGTLIENIHPDMENVVKLLADKDFEDLPKTVKRPTAPLFHGQFH